MNSEENTSPEITVKSSDNTRIVESSELPTLLESEPLYTVVRVKDKEYGYFIILDNFKGEKFWQQFNGDVEFVKKTNEWFKKGQQLFEEKPLAPEEANELKECLLAISTLGNFFTWTVDIIEGLLDQLIVTFSHRLYCKHNGLDINETDLTKLHDDEKFMAYLHATAIFVKAYSELVKEVRESVAVAVDDQNKVDKTV